MMIASSYKYIFRLSHIRCETLNIRKYDYKDMIFKMFQEKRWRRRRRRRKLVWKIEIKQKNETCSRALSKGSVPGKETSSIVICLLVWWKRQRKQKNSVHCFVFTIGGTLSLFRCFLFLFLFLFLCLNRTLRRT